MKTKLEHNNINRILSKKLGLRILGIVLLTLLSFTTFASQSTDCSNKKQNGSSCYWTTVKSVTHNANETYTITILVEVDGSSGGAGGTGCQGLSHYAVQTLTGTYSNVSWQKITGDETFSSYGEPVGGGNSQSFDTGFKLDGASNFGDNHAGSFTVTYTLTSLQDELFAAKAGSYSNDASFTIAEFTTIMNCGNQTGPTAVNDSKTTPLNTPVNITVLSNDVAGSTAIDVTSVTLGTQPGASVGTFTLNATTGVVTFTPTLNYAGIATTSYSIKDANGLIGTATITVTIQKANLVITKTATPANVTAGQDITYTITVKNTGPANARLVAVSDILSSDLDNPRPTASETTTWSAPNWTIGTLASGNTEILKIVARVKPTFTGTQITNTAYVTSPTIIPDPNNDSKTVTTPVTALPQPVAKNDDKSTTVNTTINFNVATNDQPITGPFQISFVSDQPGATIGVFTIINNTTGDVSFVPALDYIGTATINYKITDANGLFSQATITVTVTPANINNYPATGYSTIAFEDLWPALGDYDMNDLVLDYKFVINSNSNNYVDNVVGTFVIKAFGASLENGFGFQLPGIAKAADLTVTGYSLKESFINLNSNGTESGQAKPTIIVYDNAFKQMTSPGGIGCNTDPNQPYVTPKTLTITINFKPNTYTLNDLDIAHFNPFLIVNKVRGVEVHLPDYEPTSLANTSLFGTADDKSNPAQHHYYRNANNLPWAINFVQSFDYPKEKVDIITVYNHFAEWALSGGSSYPDWYQATAGYRNTNLIYQKP